MPGKPRPCWTEAGQTGQAELPAGLLWGSKQAPGAAGGARRASRQRRKRPGASPGERSPPSGAGSRRGAAAQHESCPAAAPLPKWGNSKAADPEAAGGPWRPPLPSLLAI